MDNTFTLVVLCIIIVQPQVTCAKIPDECQGCGCCAYGHYRKCENNGYCNNGCQDGYWGNRCYYKCMYNNCLRCARNNGYQCECRTGYYGFYCESWCGTNCETCDKTKGCLSCKGGYWGKTCNDKCRGNCDVCWKSDGQCSSCVKGYWGRFCYDECGSQCKTCNSLSGCTECNKGYYGSKCENYCGDNCANCDIKLGCTASDTGYYDSKCENYCGDNCASCDIKLGCTACDTGYYGCKCETYCGDNCASYDIKLGSTACDTGYYGPSCMCDANCVQCDNLKGCTSCKPGYYSNKGVCHECVLGCTCTNSQNCIGCIKGYFLESNLCSPCPYNCISCTTSTQCTSCTDGRFGNICQYQCKETCIHGICNSTIALCQCNAYYTGHNCDQCIAGYYGNDCSHRCSLGCLGTCNHADGSCKCKEGWTGNRCDTCDDIYFGNMCSEPCRSNCLSCTGDVNCQRCKPGRYGDYCQHKCGKGCINGSCDTKSGSCQCKNNKFIKSKASGYCRECVPGQYGPMCEQSCPKMCNTCENETNCVSCNDGYFGESCKKPCPDGCKSNACIKKDGSCLTCKHGYFGKSCGSTCPESCQVCDHYDSCSECKAGYSNTQKQCTCRTDICVNSVGCDSCTNISYYANDNECCLCSINNCVSCTKTIDNIHCKTCRKGYFPHNNGQCKTCNSQCVYNECDPSSGRCVQGCTHGYWNQTCDEVCDPECLSCNQEDGSCSKCQNNTKYGPSCKLECSNTCENSMCDINGICTNGCIANTFGNQCENTCDEHCTQNGNKTICSEKTGMCFYGCQTEYKGRFCPQEAEKQNWSIAALGVGIAGGVLVLAAIVVVGLFLLQQRRVNLRIESKAHENEPEIFLEMYAKVNNGSTTREENPKRDTDNFHSVTVIRPPNYQSPPTNGFGNERTHILTEDNLEIDEDDASARETAVIFEENGGFYYNNAEEISKIKLHVTDLPKYVHSLYLNDLEEEFQKIPYGLIKAYGVSQTNLNMYKNRYRGIYPYNDTRVLVRGGETDYINASFIDGFKRRNAYIATLGPMAKQLGDFGQFWRMVWQQKVEKIVMVTNLVEGKKTKCEQYWPDHNQRNMYGDIKVVCKDEQLYKDFIWRHFTLSKNSKKRSLHHLQFTSWPDKDIPDDVTSFIEFRHRVNALPSTFDGPVVVHCSSGVGRTGTFIALDILTKEGEAEGSIDISGCVINMRQNRPNMIQTLSQYKYIHQALVHTLTPDCVFIRREHFSQYMDKSSKQEIQEQFERLQSDHEKKSDKEFLATEKNQFLAKTYRKHTDMPGDSNRPHLNLFMKTDESGYINAIHIDSFKTKNRFMVAKTPLPDTVYDFIELTLQENCSCIVSMEAHLEMHKGIGLYFPGDNQTMKKGIISVQSYTDQSARHFVKRMLRFKHEGTPKKDVTIPHFQYLDWDTKNNVPKSTECFLAFVKEVEAVSKSSNLSGPILLHCSNGAGKSGLFYVVSIILEQLDRDDVVSVVNAVKTIRARRPLAIPNKEQFYFCYECVLHSTNETDKAVYYSICRDIQRK